jgi:AraC-like DNA-binding protein
MVNIEHKRSAPRPARYLSHTGVFHADTCEALRAAVARDEVAFAALARGTYPGRKLAAKALPGVMSVGYWDARQDQSWGLDWHRNEGVEITYLARGKTGFAVDGKEYPLSRGNLTITRPWQLHRVGSPTVSACRLHWMILDLGVRRPHQEWIWPDWFVLQRRDLDELTELLKHNEQPVWRADPEVDRCFENLGSIVSHVHSRTEESRLRLQINTLFLNLLELLRRQNLDLDPALSSRRRSVEMFLAALAHQVDQPWTLELMAEQCGLGRTRFTHYCYELTNMSPAEFLNRCRIRRACELLVETSKQNVTDIAFECGFSSSQYFATVFRQHLGFAPREFRSRRQSGNRNGGATTGRSIRTGS